MQGFIVIYNMPKKFGVNNKSSEAKAKKAEIKLQKQEIERKNKEDKIWEDNDKALQAKEERKKENLEKKAKEKERKEENKRLADEEVERLSKKTKETTTTKMTRAQIESARLAAINSMQAQIKKELEMQEKELDDKVNEDINPNHIARDEKIRLAQKGTDLLQATGIDQAVNLLEEEKVFKHPEKKVKKAWNQYIDDNFDAAKLEYPGLKRSQLLEILHKQFEKSDKNPFNLSPASYNAKID